MFRVLLVSLAVVAVIGIDSGNINSINHIESSVKDEGSSLLLAIISKGIKKIDMPKITETITTTTTSPTEAVFYEEAPCLVHSIRYGCICRYGDHDCEDPIIFSLL